MKIGSHMTTEHRAHLAVAQSARWASGTRIPRVEWKTLYAWMKKHYDLDPADVDRLALGEVRDILIKHNQRGSK